ncbi:glycosyltransferase family A protein [Virgibacillus sp. 6R]|uniref:glycosyltransferase family 2 protein n=1 Tax=Metabacillus sp. 22489 TaxID=3453928 RepID=UPI0011A7C578
MNQEYKVSTIIPTYKRSEMLPRAINSVLNQTHKNVEVIVVDDNDPDSDYRRDTEFIMEQYENNPKVKYIRHTENKNGAAARNTGIENSTGQILCFLDDDDWFEENKIELQLDYLISHQEYKAVYCGWHRENNVIIPEKEGNLSYGLLSGEVLIYTNTIMIWKQTASEIGGWNEEFKRNQEAVFLLRFFRSGHKIGVVPKALVRFDISDRSNVLSPEKNKELYEFYLSYHDDEINRLEQKIKGARKKIYSKRNTGVLLDFIKHKEYSRGFSHYLQYSKLYPYHFNKEIFCYISRRLFKFKS